jgi:predicted nuclease of predicted toxin-antitoxin system
VRFLADMGVSLRVVDWLRSSGHDAIHLREEGLQTLPNGEIFQKALREERIVLTFDLDFGEIVAASGGGSVSVVLFRMRNTRAEFVLQRLEIVLRQSTEDLAEGAVVLVEDGRYRVRRLPIGAGQ